MDIWIDELFTGKDSEVLRGCAGPPTDILAPRGSAKSTSLGMGLAWLIGIHAEVGLPLKILYLSFTVEIAQAKSSAIKGIIESSRYREVFPMVRILKNMRSDTRWGIDPNFAGIESVGEEWFTLYCAGLKGGITSKRSHLVVVDDPIKNPESIENPKIRAQMRNNWLAAVLPTMFTGARAFCLGTRFHYDDIHASTFTEKEGWKQIVLEAILYDDNNRPYSYWEEMWPLEELLAKKAKDEMVFAYQYQNRTPRTSELSLGPELIVKSTIAQDYDRIGVGIDLSSKTKERNDWTVFMLGGIDKGVINIIDYHRMRSMGNVEKLTALCELLADWNLLIKEEDYQEQKFLPTMSQVDLWIETVAYQASFKGDLNDILICQQGLWNLRPHEMIGASLPGDKLSRLRGTMGLLQTKRVIWNQYIDWTVPVEELLNFGATAFDDCVDAFVILTRGLAGRGAVENVPQGEALDVEYEEVN
ncbi:hypothetical protein [Synechococcus elongatus]|uniref:hypothetical protein n=1 Tax=Synechococcus elongatus TaxID=32046 RepID=UPI000F7D671C|nr:hypothetical protein [Synechococcus elongatus]